MLSIDGNVKAVNKLTVFLIASSRFSVSLVVTDAFRVDETLFSDIKIMWKACIASSSRKYPRLIYHKKS